MKPPIDILLVDDNALDRELVRRLLRVPRDGHDPQGRVIREAATAAEAVAHLAETVPDAVLLDYRLPDADGVSLLPLFAEAEVPVVMLTGMEDPESVVAAMKAGAHDYLVKNALTREGLERSVAYAVEKAALQRAVAEHQRTLAEQAAALATKNREVRALAGALTLAEQSERRRIADLLHDDLQQLLFGAKLALNVLIDGADGSSRREQVAAVEAILDEALTATRDLAVELTPPVLDREELEVALRWLAGHMSRMYGLDVAVEMEDEMPCRVPSRELRVLLLQLVRELLFNVVKHAEVGRAAVRLCECDEHYVITVADEGCGFDPAVLWAEAESATWEDAAGGFGLYSVRERLELFGGRLEVESTEGEGTQVTIHAPTSVGLPAEGRVAIEDEPA